MDARYVQSGIGKKMGTTKFFSLYYSVAFLSVCAERYLVTAYFFVLSYIQPDFTVSKNLIIGCIVTMILYYIHCHYIEKWKFENKDKMREWKCQPDKELSEPLKKKARILGTFNAGMAAVLGQFTVILRIKYGVTKIYFDPFQYGLVWYFLSWIVHYIWIEGFAYFVHRMFHIPYLYGKFHKLHHSFQPPTAFSAVAFHPIEFAIYVLGGQLIFFFIPIHFTVMIILGIHAIYYLIEDHTCIISTPIWPWQTTTLFHDDHHRYFHCNFGQHVPYWDYLFGTNRKLDRIYKEFGKREILMDKVQ